MNKIITTTIETITGTCGGVGSWISNPLSNAGPGFGSIRSLPPYSSSSTPSSSSFRFPGILQNGGAKRRIKKAKRTRRRTNKKRRKHTRKY